MNVSNMTLTTMSTSGLFIEVTGNFGARNGSWTTTSRFEDGEDGIIGTDSMKTSTVTTSLTLTSKNLLTTTETSTTWWQRSTTSKTTTGTDSTTTITSILGIVVYRVLSCFKLVTLYLDIRTLPISGNDRKQYEERALCQVLQNVLANINVKVQHSFDKTLTLAGYPGYHIYDSNKMAFFFTVCVTIQSVC